VENHGNDLRRQRHLQRPEERRQRTVKNYRLEI
jgi:hypothetical protein